MYELTITVTDWIAHGEGLPLMLVAMGTGIIALIASYGFGQE